MVDKDKVRQAYDEVAEAYAEQRSEDGEGTRILADFLDSFSDSPRVLDAGCGQGTPVLRTLSEVGAGVGMDFSREQLVLATENVPNAPLLQGGMTQLPFGDDTFDGVVAYWSLIHIPLDDHQKVIDEFARVLRPDGLALVCEGKEGWSGENPDWLDEGVEMQWNIAGEEATRQQLEEAGFEIVESWSAPESKDEEDSDEDDWPWIFFSARLDT